MTLRSRLISQFRRPNGMLGRIAGWIMAYRPSNRMRNRWTVDLLDIQPDHSVLELGPGPGATLRYVLKQAVRGRVTAIDHSPLMLAACRRRNRRAVLDGRLTLIESPFPGIPDGMNFDRILAVNSLQFDALSVESIRSIAGHLAPGGVLAVTLQPRSPNASREKAVDWGAGVTKLMTNAGLEDIRVEILPLKPVSAVCVLGRRAARFDQAGGRRQDRMCAGAAKVMDPSAPE